MISLQSRDSCHQSKLNSKKLS